MDKAKVLMDLEKKKNRTEMHQQQLVLQGKIEALMVAGEEKQIEYQARLAKVNGEKLMLVDGLRKERQLEGKQQRQSSPPPPQQQRPVRRVSMPMNRMHSQPKSEAPKTSDPPALLVPPHPSDKLAMTMHIHRLQRAQRREEEEEGRAGKGGRRVPLRERIARARCVWWCCCV